VTQSHNPLLAVGFKS